MFVDAFAWCDPGGENSTTGSGRGWRGWRGDDAEHPLFPGYYLGGKWFGWLRLASGGYGQSTSTIGVTAKIVILLALAEVGGGDPEGRDHLAGDFGVDAVARDSGEHHGGGLEDGLGVAQGVEDIGAEAGAGAEGAAASAAELLVVIAEGAVDEGGRLAEAAVGLGVAAERVDGFVHSGSLRKALILGPI